MPDNQQLDPMTPLHEAPEEVKRIIKRVLKLESEKLYQQKPHVRNDIVRIIKEEVQ